MAVSRGNVMIKSQRRLRFCRRGEWILIERLALSEKLKED